MSENAARGAGELIVELVRLSLQELAGKGNATTQLEAFRDRIREHIGQHLRDPSLTLDHIAQALNCSKRHLHNAFSAEDDTLAHYIQRQRVQALHAGTLPTPSRSQRTITEIAFSWGFNNGAHFSRVFRSTRGSRPVISGKLLCASLSVLAETSRQRGCGTRVLRPTLAGCCPSRPAIFRQHRGLGACSLATANGACARGHRNPTVKRPLLASLGAPAPLAKGRQAKSESSHRTEQAKETLRANCCKACQGSAGPGGHLETLHDPIEPCAHHPASATKSPGSAKAAPAP